MDAKFLKQDKSPLLNPVDWFNFFGSFPSIFEEDKRYSLINDCEVSFMDISPKKEAAFKLNSIGHISVLKENGNDIPTNSEISKFMLLTAVKFKGDYSSAMSHVSFNLMKNEVPYIRVGTDYFKVIKKTDRYGGTHTLLKHWKKDEVKEDHAKTIMKLIPRFDDFTILPNNKQFIPVKNSCYNLYSRFAHEPFGKDVSHTDIPYSIGILEHIFGDQLQLGLKYMKLLYEHPKQILPILALVSTERGTGKTTFLNWMHMLFGENSVLISPHDITSSFNSIYATKNIVMVDETVIEKSASVEKLKSLATAKSISVSQKFVSEYSIPFFAKIILCTNKEKDFMRIDEEEVRFWIRKIKPVENLNTNIEQDLFSEIPKFLKYLIELPEIDLKKSRMVFTKEEIKTEQLNDIKKESKSTLFKEMEILFEDLFLTKGINEFEASPIDIKTRFFNHNNNITISYIRKVIKDEMKLLTEENKRYYPFGERILDSKPGTPFLFKNPNKLQKTQLVEYQDNNEIPF